MTTPRRRVLRRAKQQQEPRSDPRAEARLQKQRMQLAKDRVALKRWLTRLKRATNTVTELHQRISKQESTLSTTKGSVVPAAALRALGFASALLIEPVRRLVGYFHT
jgi:hypothetical protein